MGGFCTIIFVVFVFSYALAEAIPVIKHDIKNIRLVEELLDLKCLTDKKKSSETSDVDFHNKCAKFDIKKEDSDFDFAFGFKEE